MFAERTPRRRIATVSARGDWRFVSSGTERWREHKVYRDDEIVEFIITQLTTGFQANPPTSSHSVAETPSLTPPTCPGDTAPIAS